MDRKVNIDGCSYIITDPVECTHPKGTVVEKIIHDDDTWVLAVIRYKGGSPALGLRWHVSDREKTQKTNQQKCIGYPNSHHQPTWQVLPDNILNVIQSYLIKDK